MKKTFKLPKKFTEEWLEALKSGEYNQTKSLLVKLDDEDGLRLSNSEIGYCCLGLGLKLCDVDVDSMSGHELPENYGIKPDNFPANLYHPNHTRKSDTFNKSDLIEILTFLNDGFYINAYNKIIKVFPDLQFKKIPTESKASYYSFEEIAEWIEDNIELV